MSSEPIIDFQKELVSEDTQRVLLLEDQDFWADIMRRCVETCGYDMEHANDALTFKAMYEGQEWHAVILDVFGKSTPGDLEKAMIGIDLAQRIKAEAPGLRVAVNSSLTPYNLNELESEGIVYIPKPVCLSAVKLFLE